MPSCPHDFPAYCWPSLGLGNTAGAETLEGDVWGAQIRRAPMIFPPTVGPLWGSEIQQDVDVNVVDVVDVVDSCRRLM